MLQRFQSSTMNMLFWYFYFSFFRVFCVAREYSGFCIGFSVIGKSRLYQKHRKGSQISTESCQSWNTEAKFGSFMTGDAKAWKKVKFKWTSQCWMASLVHLVLHSSVWGEGEQFELNELSQHSCWFLIVVIVHVGSGLKMSKAKTRPSIFTVSAMVSHKVTSI